jgi:hypothetical protein
MHVIASPAGWRLANPPSPSGTFSPVDSEALLWIVSDMTAPRQA